MAQFFVKLKTAEEVMEYTGAFMQLYREEGWYLDAPCTTLGRVGLDYVKEGARRPRGRKGAVERAPAGALDGEPDPWFEFDKARVDQRQFIPSPSPEQY